MSDRIGEGPGAGRGRLFAALRNLEQRYRDNVAGLPPKEEPPEIWAGVLYLVGSVALLSPLTDVEEVLNFPQDITRVPASRPWVCGIANNRGTLLPVFDMRAFLFAVSTGRNSKNRVLVVRDDEFPYGLLVSDVIGIRHFETSLYVSRAQGFDHEIDGLLAGSFTQGGERYPVLSLQKLGLDPRFNLAAA